MPVLFFPGCMFFPNAEFNFLSSTVISEDDFPLLQLRFSATNTITLECVSSANELLYSKEFFKGTHTAHLPLERCRHTPIPGSYYVAAYDSADHVIFENEMDFSGGNLEILSVSEQWWQDKISYCIVGLTLSVRNKGDLPVYPRTLNGSVEDVSFSEPVLPTAILPLQTKSVTAFVYLPDIQSDTPQLTVSLTSSDPTHSASKIVTLQRPDPISLGNLYQWQQKGSYTLRLPEVPDLYQYYQRLERLPLQDYASYSFASSDDTYIGLVADRVDQLFNENDEVQRLNHIAGFVQHLPYSADDEEDETYEYPRYPVEMLVDKRGDCEDKAILAVSLLDHLGYETALLRLPNHMAVGVQFDTPLQGYSTYAEDYYFLETTRASWPVGKIPDEYQQVTNITVYPITQRPVLIHQWNNATRYRASDGTDYVDVDVQVENYGSSIAHDVLLKGLFVHNTLSFNIQTVILDSIPSEGRIRETIRVHVPTHSSTLLKTQLLLNNEVVHEKESEDSFP